jgi:hypothetical protein
MERAVSTVEIHPIEREVLVHVSRQLPRGHPGHVDVCRGPVALAYPVPSGVELVRAVLIEAPCDTLRHPVNEREAGETMCNREATEVGPDRLEYVFNQTLQSTD